MASDRTNAKTIFYANTLEEAFYQLKTVADLQIVGGCTAISELAEKTLSIRTIPELCSFDKHERYFDFGPGVTLAQIEAIGKNNLPAVLYEALHSIANPQIKNMATIGGNLCNSAYKHTLFAPLLALDTRLEVKREQETAYIPLAKFTGVPEQYLLTKIRIPTDEWEVAVFRRLGPAHIITDMSASFVFLANTQKNMIANLRIACAGSFCFRSMELENKLIGSHLPIPEKNIMEFIEEAEAQFSQSTTDSEITPIVQAQFLNLVKFSLEQLT